MDPAWKPSAVRASEQTGQGRAGPGANHSRNYDRRSPCCLTEPPPSGILAIEDPLPRILDLRVSGARRARTADLLGAIQALSQLSYSPGRIGSVARGRFWRDELKPLPSPAWTRPPAQSRRPPAPLVR